MPGQHLGHLIPPLLPLRRVQGVDAADHQQVVEPAGLADESGGDFGRSVGGRHPTRVRKQHAAVREPGERLRGPQVDAAVRPVQVNPNRRGVGGPREGAAEPIRDTTSVRISACGKQLGDGRQPTVERADAEQPSGELFVQPELLGLPPGTAVRRVGQFDEPLGHEQAGLAQSLAQPRRTGRIEERDRQLHTGSPPGHVVLEEAESLLVNRVGIGGEQQQPEIGRRERLAHRLESRVKRIDGHLLRPRGEFGEHAAPTRAGRHGRAFIHCQTPIRILAITDAEPHFRQADGREENRVKPAT